MKRILIIGSAGAGKSTLSRQLSARLNLPVVHLDRYYWRPGWSPTPNEEWDRFVIEAANEDQWIMDGNYSRTLELRLQRADTVIFLDLSRWLCLYRVMKRRIQYHGKTRPDLNDECPEKLDWAFISWVWNYKKRSRDRVMEQLKSFGEQKYIIIVKSRKQVKEIANQLEETKEIKK